MAWEVEDIEATVERLRAPGVVLALGLYPSELLKESQGYDLGVREPLEGGVASSARLS